MSDADIRSAETSGNVSAELASKARAGQEGGRLYLAGHVSPATAHVSADYPFGFRGKCFRRTWIEQKARHGFRVMHQTSAPYYPPATPDVASVRWNKPKGSTYTDVMVLYLDENGHIETDRLGSWNPLPDSSTNPESDIETFKARAVRSLTPEVEKAIRDLTIVRRALSRVKYTINAHPSEPVDILREPERLAELAKEQEARKLDEKRYIGALIRNETAKHDGNAIPFPSLEKAQGE